MTIQWQVRLDLNVNKTSIDRIALSSQSSWLSELDAFLSHQKNSLRGKRLQEFLSLSLRLQAELSTQPVINYALAIIEHLTIPEGDVKETESFLLKAAVLSPASLDRICRVILNLKHHHSTISTKRITERFLTLAARAIDREHHYEVIWLLFTLRGLKRPFSSKTICDAAEFMPSAAIALLLLDIKSKNIITSKLPSSTWEGIIDEASIHSGWTWLLAYEGFRHGWLNDKAKLMQSPFFKPMIDRNVVFYDETRNVLKSSSVKTRNARLRRNNNQEIMAFFTSIRREGFWDY